MVVLEYVTAKHKTAVFGSLKHCTICFLDTIESKRNEYTS